MHIPSVVISTIMSYLTYREVLLTCSRVSSKWYSTSLVPTSYRTIMCNWKIGKLLSMSPRFKLVNRFQCLYASPRAIKLAVRLPRLTHLDIRHTDSVVNWEVLESMSLLRTLDLSWAVINQFSFLLKLVNLRVLKLVGTAFESTEFLKNCTHLRTLSLGYTPVRNIEFYSPGLKALGMRDCRSLRTRDCVFSHTRLQYLSLSATSTNNATLNFLPKDTLTWLNLSNCQLISQSGFHALRNLPLTYLDLTRTHIINLNALVGLSQLKCLNVSHTRLSDISLQCIISFPKLEVLNLKWCDLLTTKCWKWIHQHPRLRAVYTQSTRL